MRDHSSHVEVSRQKATELLLANSNFTPAIETIAVQDADGRILAQDAVAQLDMPNCLTCNMDSVAIHWDDFKDGMPDTTGWVRGDQWEFANTGIGMPVGFDTAIVIENVELSDDLSQIAFKCAPSEQYAGTSPAGNRMHAGDVLVPAGTELTPLLISHIASGNNTEVAVYAKPRVAFIPTGNELVKPGCEVPRGKNIETNSILAAAKIRQWGGEPIVMDIAPDNQQIIKETVLEACKLADIVVLNAGSSKGSDDWNIEMLEEVGTVLYHETNHGPGHHSSGAVVDGTPVVGISGPPAGANFTLDFYLYPMIRAYYGQPVETKKVYARLTAGFSAKHHHDGADKKKGEDRPSVVKPAREFFGIKQLKLEYREDGTVWATPASSSHLTASESNEQDGYYPQPKNAAPAAGEIIEIEIRP